MRRRAATEALTVLDLLDRVAAGHLPAELGHDDVTLLRCRIWARRGGDLYAVAADVDRGWFWPLPPRWHETEARA